MNAVWALLAGVGLGLRHAADADHIAVLSTLIEREGGAWRAARVAAYWGAGHSATFIALGLLIIQAGIRVPPAFESLAELLVAVLLVAFGVAHLKRNAGQHGCYEAAAAAAPRARPVLLGLLHGLAGSTGIALVAAASIEPRALASAYLISFGFGTVVGMLVLTVCMSRAMAWSARLDRRSGRALAVLAAALSIGIGLALLLGALFGESS